MNYTGIIAKEEGIYTIAFDDGSTALLFRAKKGHGYTIAHVQPNKPWWCVDYDEDGNIECEYPRS